MPRDDLVWRGRCGVLLKRYLPIGPFICDICGQIIDDPVPIHVFGNNIYLHNRRKGDCLDTYLDMLTEYFKPQPEDITF